jgi:hypothetical protein
MLGYTGLVSVIIGGITAYVAERFPSYVDVLQTIGGLLLVVGFVLVGSNMPEAI